ncbi:17889_t:CDS:1 [Funneliformis caledonium]|uniref:17889_t:CDS:1 n=1 Tax=Funneliformis caledonium TaxID=1117310 RepID=A0A9N9GGS6_9GLOM|nr:17889_t:CDS:1 [Funneliformis caledonium]
MDQPSYHNDHNEINGQNDLYSGSINNGLNDCSNVNNINQMEQSLNPQIPCSCANFPTSNNNIYENTSSNYSMNNQNGTQGVSPITTHMHAIPLAQHSLPTSKKSSQQFSKHDDNPQNNYAELFKIEIKGIEIIIRQKSIPTLNQNYFEIQNQPTQMNEHQNRMMYPYPDQNFRHNNYNRFGPQQFQYHPYYYYPCPQY